MMFLAPYLSDEEVAELYSDSYFSQGEECELGLAPVPDMTYREALGIRFPKFEATLEVLQGLVPTGASLLDVGAGTGEFVQLARQRGLDADGVEFSKFAVEDAIKRYGLHLNAGRLSEFKSTRRYDVVHLNHVFEHLSDPHVAVKAIEGLIAERGIVYVEVPYQFIVEKMKYWLWKVRPPFSLHSLHHPVFFTPKTLVELFSDHGFMCIKLNLFDEAHYPVTGTRSRLKALTWRALAAVGQGLFIEAIFCKRSGL